MRTIETIVEKEIRSHIDSSDLCQEIVMAGTKDPKSYDAVIESACRIVEDLIKINFEYIITLASLEDEVEEDDEEELPTAASHLMNISSEDEDMLRFIEG